MEHIRRVFLLNFYWIFFHPPSRSQGFPTNPVTAHPLGDQWSALLPSSSLPSSVPKSTPTPRCSVAPRWRLANPSRGSHPRCWQLPCFERKP